jgi:hypothetical protein
MQANLKKVWTPRATRRLAAMTLLLITSLTLLPTGCATRTMIKEIPMDRTVVTMHAGVPFTPACDGKFVPSARFNEMLDVYIRESWRK